MSEPYCYVGPRRIAAALILAGFPDKDAELIPMVATHGAETSGNVRAIGGPNPNGSYDYGAFQINVAAGAYPPDNWADYLINAKYAVNLYKLSIQGGRSGFAPWYGYKNIDRVAGFAARPGMTWRQWATLGVRDMRASVKMGRTLNQVASIYLPLDGVGTWL